MKDSSLGEPLWQVALQHSHLLRSPSRNDLASPAIEPDETLQEN